MASILEDIIRAHVRVPSKAKDSGENKSLLGVPNRKIRRENGSSWRREALAAQVLVVLRSVRPDLLVDVSSPQRQANLAAQHRQRTPRNIQGDDDAPHQ